MPATAERRFLPSAAPTVKGRTVEGHAAKFNVRSENLGTTEKPQFEIIAPGAFDDVLNDDVLALWNHDESAILARSSNGVGSLKLTVDRIGLHYRFTAPDTTLGNDILELVRRGDVRAASFAFRVSDEKFSRDPDGSNIRTIIKVSRLFDVSVVSRPAYPDATVAVRSMAAPVQGPSLATWRSFYDILS